MGRKGKKKQPSGQEQSSSQPSEQQVGPSGPPQQQVRPSRPSQQQVRPSGPPQQQVRPSGPPRQQVRPSGPPQQQTARVPWQQVGPSGPPQQQGRPSGPPQQQAPSGPLQQQVRPSGPPRQQVRPSGPPQQQAARVPWQQVGPSGPPQQQGRPSGPPQQQAPSGPLQQQVRPSGPPQQPRVSGLQQQEGQSESRGYAASKSEPVKGNGRGTMSASLKDSYTRQIPIRTNAKGGTQGRPIFVETNMFRIAFSPKFETNVTHYDVVISPDKPKFLMRPVFEEYRKKHFPRRYPAFDGKKNAYSANDLPFGDTSIEDEVRVFDHERQSERTFTVYLKKAANIDLSWLKCQNLSQLEYSKEQTGIQALDIILRHGPASRFITVGRSLFNEPEPGRVVSLTDGLDLWIGVFQSAVVGWRPYLNVDVAHKGFPKSQSVIDLMKDLCRDPRSRDAEPLRSVTAENVNANFEKIIKFLKGLKVQFEIPGQPSTKRTYRVNGLVECPRKNEFILDDKTKTTVEKYFSETKRYRIQYPELPCLWVGSRQTKIYMPIELCTIVAGQVIQKKLSDNQTSKMVREAATDTQRRKEKILKGFAKINLNQSPTVTNEFHLSVQGEFEKVPARVLPPPMIKYDARNVTVSKGVWRADKFLKPSDLPDNSWTILNLDRYVNARELQDSLYEKLRMGGNSVNMTIGKAQTPFATLSILGRDITQVMRYFEEKKKQNIKLIVVVIPTKLETAYSQVKQICELKITGGIVTQCIKAQTLKKMSEATVTNILLKINSKLNGVNHAFVQRPPCLNVPCMLVGADVTHPSPDATDTPSIAAVAASHDPNAFKYNIELRLQSPREEMIQDLEEIMRKQLLYFYRQTGCKPLKLIFYRDGVSEGQLPQVMHYELDAIRRAINKIEPSGEHKIAITFLVVQKRHHVRLFPTDRRNSDDRNFNVQAGTIVDTEITHPTQVDFYLVSHASIQGTARPTKYRCLCNENKMSDNEIEQLTYYLCHMFARCTRSVSYPAPTYYAHLAAFRARALINNVPLNITNLQEEQRRKMTLQLNTTSPMFFV